MKKTKIDPEIPDEVEFIGGAGSLTEEDERLISEYIRSQKEKAKAEKNSEEKRDNGTGSEQPGAANA